MDNNSVISRLRECVRKLEDNIRILKEKRDNITSDTEALIKQRQRLTKLLAEMIAKKHSLEVVINERTAAVAGAIPALSSAQVAKFTAQMNILNEAIQADQGFDRIVAIAKGINSASAEIGRTTGKPA